MGINKKSVDWFETLNKKELSKAEMIQKEIMENIEYNLYNDGLILL